MKPNPREKAVSEFMSWLKRFEPRAYAYVKSRVGSPPNEGIFAALNTFGQVDPYGGVGVPTASPPASSTGGWMDYINSALSVAKEAIPAYFQYETQKDLMEMNIERAKQGLPPIDPGVVAPQVKVIHDVPPEAQQAISQFKVGGNVLLWGAIGLGAFLLIRMFAR